MIVKCYPRDDAKAAGKWLSCVDAVEVGLEAASSTAVPPASLVNFCAILGMSAVVIFISSGEVVTFVVTQAVT